MAENDKTYPRNRRNTPTPDAVERRGRPMMMVYGGPEYFKKLAEQAQSMMMVYAGPPAPPAGSFIPAAPDAAEAPEEPEAGNDGEIVGVCPQCGYALRALSRFCPNCGAPQAWEE